MMKSHVGLLAAVVAFVALAPAAAHGLPPLPAGWPTRLELGVADGPGGAAGLASETGWGFRYQYLSGGVDTGAGWAGWLPPGDGAFVSAYIAESRDAGIIPVFSYYVLRQSPPGNALAEDVGDLLNLATVTTMRAYYEDLRLFFQRAGEFPDLLVVLHLEPDLWGYIHRAAIDDDAASVPAAVATTGLAELAGLPDTATGFARAIARLRDRYAPNVQLAYSLSVWGTSSDIASSDPPDPVVDALAIRAANYYGSLDGGFDLIFAEFTDRDAGYAEHVGGDGGASWWDAGDFARMARYLGGVVQATGRRVVMWQIPLGNTRMRAMNNTSGHYQDNRVEWFLDDASRDHLKAYLQAGVIAFLFGNALPGTTCACDATGDGTTDPPPINGNTGLSLSADDDGGFFRARAKAYYQAGALVFFVPVPPVVYTDVPTSYWARPFIDALSSAGVTGGCATAPPAFCPEALATRQEMAVFLLRAREGADYVPPPCTAPPFGDVPCASPFAPWIQELAGRGIVAGCGGGKFCPTAPVTREQMAVFLLKTALDPGYVPPACTTASYADVPCASPFARWIEDLVARELTGGCSATTYCPTGAVTRAQMAVFLVKAFGL
jgi:hypothetical protein